MDRGEILQTARHLRGDSGRLEALGEDPDHLADVALAGPSLRPQPLAQLRGRRGVRRRLHKRALAV